MECINLMGRLGSYKVSRKGTKKAKERKEFVSVAASLPRRKKLSLYGIIFLLQLIGFSSVVAQQPTRLEISLNNNWHTIASSGDKPLPKDLDKSTIDKNWKKVNVPHNWDAYEGYRRLLHGNRHGDSWYRKTFTIKQAKGGKRFFLFFEGVGSYATVFVNGVKVGKHAGGRTTFTIDITNVIRTDGSNNQLAVRAYHPSGIKDLPWVCGGCSDERGFSEGSQPMGIFRPVHLMVTNDVRIEPFGVHAWADFHDDIVRLSVKATIKNYSKKARGLSIRHLLIDAVGNTVAEVLDQGDIRSGDSVTVASLMRPGKAHLIKLWSVENPYLYKIVSTVRENNSIIDEVITPFGFRTINWKTSSRQFLLNDKPLFINGIAEYEHLLGQSHAFSHEQVISRMKWIKLAGFNAFRDAHQPHNLLYGKLCNEQGILWWTQFSAHVWYESPAFRQQFLQLLKEWVIERRNDPSVILWGLQNESKIPEDFAKECTDLIRSLDPTTSSQRLVTTCNGGSGTDWDVPQNWTGTYGGDPATYASDIKKQVLIGEYGAWRTIDLHTEGGFVQNGILSEDRMTQLMEQKIRLAESVKDSCAGQFFWLLTSHDNPGRVQGGEGLRDLDRIGPVNYKGLLTPWEEPTDAFYMFRSNYAPKDKDPMVYIVSHTWPNRWMRPGIKDSIIVYSNCDEVELFNDLNKLSLGKRTKNGKGTHFQWDKVNIQYNILVAIGYVNGKPVAGDTIVLNHLPSPADFNQLIKAGDEILQPDPAYEYLYRLNCGGPEYKDEFNNLWVEDKSPASSSWAQDFPGMPPFFASQRRTFAPIKGTKDWKLFQSFRYGKNKLFFEFPVKPGEYRVELYFVEAWLGIGSRADHSAMRVFDVAINGTTVIDDLDIWKEAGSNRLLKKTVFAKVTGNKMIVSFPETKVGQAIISAISISYKKKMDRGVEKIESPQPFDHLRFTSWLDIGDKPFMDESITFNSLPPDLYGCDWISLRDKKTTLNIRFPAVERVNVFVAVLKPVKKPKTIADFEDTGAEIITDENGGTVYTVYRKLFEKDRIIKLDRLSNCVIVIRPVGNMQPAYDLRSVTPYRTNVATVSAGVKKEMFASRECAVVKSKAEVTIQYPIQTGVADRYSITVKYFYPARKELKGRLQLIGAGNSMMMDEPVSFTFTRSGKWNQFTINTTSMINAGNYTVRLVLSNAEGLAVSGIDIQ